MYVLLRKNKDRRCESPSWLLPITAKRKYICSISRNAGQIWSPCWSRENITTRMGIGISGLQLTRWRMRKYPCPPLLANNRLGAYDCYKKDDSTLITTRTDVSVDDSLSRRTVWKGSIIDKQLPYHSISRFAIIRGYLPCLCIQISLL